MNKVEFTIFKSHDRAETIVSDEVVPESISIKQEEPGHKIEQGPAQPPVTLRMFGKIPFPRESYLTREQHKKYLELYEKYSRHAHPVADAQELNLYKVFLKIWFYISPLKLQILTMPVKNRGPTTK